MGICTFPKLARVFPATYAVLIGLLLVSSPLYDSVRPGLSRTSPSLTGLRASYDSLMTSCGKI